MNFKAGLMAGLMAAGSSVMAAEGEGLKVGGFVDAQYNWAHQDGQENDNSFGVNDGALYLGKTMGLGEVMVDIPFFYSVNAQNNDGNNNFAIATAKAQAFVAWHYENGFGWKLGQFDSPFGLEGKDTVDVVLSHQGVIDEFMPLTHTGLQLSYELSDLLGVHFIIANPYNMGAMNKTTGTVSTKGNPDVGFKVASKFDTFKASVAGLFFSQDGEKGYIVDVIAGTKLMDKLDVDVEVTFDKAREITSVNTTTHLFTTAVGADTRFGAGLHLGYMMSEKLNLATRFEYTKQDETKVLAWAVGPQWWASKDTVIKLDYTLVKTSDLVDTTNHAINVAAVQKF